MMDGPIHPQLHVSCPCRKHARSCQCHDRIGRKRGSMTPRSIPIFPFVKTQPNHHPFLSGLPSWHSLTYVRAQPRKMDNTAPTFEQLALAFPEDGHYALRRFLTPLHHGDVHRDLLRVLYRPRRVWCRCGAARRSTARYRARVAILSELEKRLPWRDFGLSHLLPLQGFLTFLEMLPSLPPQLLFLGSPRYTTWG